MFVILGALREPMISRGLACQTAFRGPFEPQGFLAQRQTGPNWMSFSGRGDRAIRTSTSSLLAAARG